MPTERKEAPPLKRRRRFSEDKKEISRRRDQGDCTRSRPRTYSHSPSDRSVARSLAASAPGCDLSTPFHVLPDGRSDRKLRARKAPTESGTELNRPLSGTGLASSTTLVGIAALRDAAVPVALGGRGRSRWVPLEGLQAGIPLFAVFETQAMGPRYEQPVHQQPEGNTMSLEATTRVLRRHS